MRAAYLVGAIIVVVLELFNAPRLPWILAEEGGPVGIFRGFAHGMVGFSYMVTWALLVGGVYQVLLGVIYWDMDTTEAERWQYILQSGGTARLLWVTGGITFLLGAVYAVFIYTNDRMLWPCGVASTLIALAACWLFWLAFPLYEQVGIDREEIGV